MKKLSDIFNKFNEMGYPVQIDTLREWAKEWIKYMRSFKNKDYETICESEYYGNQLDDFCNEDATNFDEVINWIKWVFELTEDDLNE